MPSRTENIFRIRDILDNPYPNRPSLHQLLRQELVEEQDIVNELNNTGKAWATAEYQLTYTPNQSVYEIDAADFGKPLYVLRVTNNQYVPYIPVPFADVQSLDYSSVWTGFYGLWNGFAVPNVTPEKFAFYRENALDTIYKVEIRPAPAESASYIITYIQGYLGSADPLESVLTLPEHANLVQLRGATALLPYSEWYESAEMNAAKRKELAQSFLYQLDRKEMIYETYKRSLVVPRPVLTDDWNAY